MNPSWKIDRRSMLKGMGASLALPLLEVMGNDSQEKEERIKRVCYIFFGNGVAIPREDDPARKNWHWWPLEAGGDYKFTKSLEPFAPFKDKITIMSGLWHPNYSGINIHGDAMMWMTGNTVGDPGSKYSADQIYADTFGRKTRFPSLSLSSEGGVGSIDNAATLSGSVSGRPVPSLHDPRVIFNKLFKSPEGSRTERKKVNRYQAKLVDMVKDNAEQMARKLSKNDKVKMEQFMTSLSDIEESINNDFSWIDKPTKMLKTDHINENVDSSVDPDKFYTTMFDLMTLAYEADLTRSITFAMSMSGPNGIADTFPQLIVKSKKGHHMWTHAPGPYNKELHLGIYDRYLSSKMANFIRKLNSIKVGNDSILDNTAVLYGSANSSNHNWKNLPLLLAGGKNLGFKHGSHIKYDGSTPMNNLHLSILHSVGIMKKRYGDSTGILKELFV